MSTMTALIPTTTKIAPMMVQKVSPPVTAPEGKPNAEVTSDRIRAHAYEIFQVRNGNDKGGAGDPTSDWLQAERELNGSVRDPTASTAVEVKVPARGEKLLAVGK